MKPLLLTVLCSWCMTAFAVKEGDIAPFFSLPILDGVQEVGLADFKGKVIYLDFWASWCGPCRISLPQIVELQAELGTDQFAVIAINLDEQEQDAVRFLRRFPVNYRVLSDSKGQVAEIYQLPGMPSSFVIDRARKITLAHTGFKQGDMRMIRDHIKGLINQDE
ncbi:MAG: TlpA disulfide reductase family protein [bacterium]|nr:TlpA family protein disulfide reductase [Gammaproteobacteria bacterium]HIL94856.1 TlpA family protein disulfide reductase [Pseudomonadales bacterium]